jgi:hypothetical protein
VKSSSLTISPQSLIETRYVIFIETEILQYIERVSADAEGFADSKCLSTEVVIRINFEKSLNFKLFKILISFYSLGLERFISKQKCKFSTDIHITLGKDSNILRTSVDSTVAQQAVGSVILYIGTQPFLKCLLYIVAKIEFLNYTYAFNLSRLLICN